MPSLSSVCWSIPSGHLTDSSRRREVSPSAIGDAEPTCVSVVYLSWSNAVSLWIPLRTHTSKQTYTKQPIIIPHETCLIFACETGRRRVYPAARKDERR